MHHSLQWARAAGPRCLAHPSPHLCGVQLLEQAFEVLRASSAEQASRVDCLVSALHQECAQVFQGLCHPQVWHLRVQAPAEPGALPAAAHHCLQPVMMQ